MGGEGVILRPPFFSLAAPDSVILGLDPRIQASHRTLDSSSVAVNISTMAGFVYIVTNQKNGTLYIGVTSDIAGRIYQHREGLTPGFASKYDCGRLVWYEEHFEIGSAIQREKSLKRWLREWKIALIEKDNPQWRDLYPELW